MLHCIAFPVVSEWCQSKSHDTCILVPFLRITALALYYTGILVSLSATHCDAVTCCLLRSHQEQATISNRHPGAVGEGYEPEEQAYRQV